MVLLCCGPQHCHLTLKLTVLGSIRQAMFSMASILNMTCFQYGYEKLCTKTCLLYLTVHSDRQRKPCRASFFSVPQDSILIQCILLFQPIIDSLKKCCPHHHGPKAWRTLHKPYYPQGVIVFNVDLPQTRATLSKSQLSGYLVQVGLGAFQ